MENYSNKYKNYEISRKVYQLAQLTHVPKSYPNVTNHTYNTIIYTFV